MYILIFETIHDFASVALFCNNILLDSMSGTKPISQAESIIVITELILLRNNLVYVNINYFVTLSGPGSFIRIRVALSVAFGIEVSLNRVVIGVNLFDLYNFLFYAKYNRAPDMVVLYAYQDNFYVRKYDLLGKFEDHFLKSAEIREIVLKKARIACDSITYHKLYYSENHFLNKEILFDVQADIKNFSVACGLFVVHKIKDHRIDLDNPENLRPFYLFNPIFNTKKQVVVSNVSNEENS